MNSIRMFPTLAILAALLTLGSCGGDNAALETSQRTAPRMKALGISPTATAHISAITKISEVRISRTVYDYIFAVTITNGSIAQTDIVAELVSTGSGATIIDGVSRVARLARNESVVSGDRITIRQNRTIPFDASLLEWRISGALNPDSAIATIDSTGGTIQTPSGRLRLDIPFGALSSPQTVEISPADSDDTDEYPITGTAFHIIPEGLTFNKPVLITLKYDPAALPQGVNASDLLIGYKAGETSGMIQTVLDEPNHSLIGQISHFSRWYARGKTTTPAYVRGGLSIQSAKWETTDPNLIDGCWRVGENENQRQYFTDVEKLARALFKSQIPLTKPFTEHTGIGCITNPYLKNWYSIETPIPNENHAGIDFRTAGGDTVVIIIGDRIGC